MKKRKALYIAICLAIFSIVGTYQGGRIQAEDTDVFTAEIENTNTGLTQRIECTFKILKEADGEGKGGEVQIGDGISPAIDTSTIGDIELPDTVTENGITYTVTKVGANAFWNLSNLTSTGLENNTTINEIGVGAFSLCPNLLSTGLEHNHSVTTLDGAAFWGCTKLQSTGLANNQTVTSIGEEAFLSCIALTDTGLATNRSVTFMGMEAFSNCSSLTSTGLEGNETITNLSEAIFSYCSNLTSTGLESNHTITSIGKKAFSGCPSLTSTGLEKNASVTIIGDEAFSNCLELKDTGLATNDMVTTIGNGAFLNCEALTDTGLKNNETVSNLGDSAFSHCFALTSTGLEHNKTLTRIGEGTFRECRSLTSTGLESDEAITEISKEAFYACKMLEHTGLENNQTVTSIEEGVFTSCESLKDTGLATNHTVKTLGNFAFSGCKSLTDTGLGDNQTITSIGAFSFFQCVNLTSTGLENNQTITYIGNVAFAECTKLKEVTLSNNSNIQTIGNQAFYGCEALSAFVITGKKMPTFGTDVFKDPASDFAIYYPTHITDGTVSIAPEDAHTGKQMENSFTKGTKVTITMNPTAGKIFKKWMINDGAIKPADPANPTTTFAMTEDVVNIRAAFDYVDYSASIENGRGEGTYHVGDMVTISADKAEKGKHFKKWEVVRGDVKLADDTKATTSFTMPAQDVEVKAIYEDTMYQVDVKHGTSDKVSSKYNEKVTITADKEEKGKHFKKWEVVRGDVKLADDTKATTSFTMPAQDVEVKAIYEDTMYQVDVKHGTSDKVSSKYNEKVTITANKAEKGKHFKKWEVVRGDVKLADDTKATTSFTMPAQDIEVKAIYENDPKPIVYSIIEGAKSTWIRGKGEDYRLWIDAPFDKFINIKINGNILDRKYYRIEKGSTIITISQEYLKSLQEGTYRIDVQYSDGTSHTVLTIGKVKPTDHETKKSTAIDTRKAIATGDTTNVVIPVVTMITALLVLAYVVVRKKHLKK